MIPENNFWNLVGEANRDLDQFRKILNSMDKNELKEFVWMFRDKIEDLGDDAHMDAVLNGVDNITEDALEDLLGWIVGKGKKYYLNIIKNPEETPSSILDEDRGIEIQYEAAQIYYSRFNEHIPHN
jgi:hypothetical protein